MTEVSLEDVLTAIKLGDNGSHRPAAHRNDFR